MSTTDAADSQLFTRAYTRGVTEEQPEPARSRRRLVTGAAPVDAFALRGAVITDDAVLPDGYVVVEGETISEVGTTKPTGLRILETGGVILPGLIDLHGHPEFNVFAAWEPPRQYANRYRWRSSVPYHALIRDPQNVLLTKVPTGTQLRYAEIRALVGGVTAIQGASRSPDSEPLVRNVDLRIFGQHRARSMIDLPSSEKARDYPRLQSILADIKDGAVDAFYLHLCEGQAGDQRSQSEFDRFLAMKAATPATVVIHGSALSADQLAQLAGLGCKLVWSPQSNLRLYGQTTLAGAALAAGMPVALGADWLPSGSTSLLAELKVARRELERQGHPLQSAELVRMVTSGAAAIAGLDQFIGTLRVGAAADILVLQRHHDDPYENVCLADPDWVELVMIGGDVAYGRQDWFDQLTGGAAGPSIDLITAWGKSMKLDAGFHAPAGQAPSSLANLRAQLTTAYPPVGPIFA